MMKFDAPVNLNGQELREELRAAGIDIENGMGQVILIDADLYLNIDPKFGDAAAAIVANHNGTI